MSETTTAAGMADPAARRQLMSEVAARTRLAEA